MQKAFDLIIKKAIERGNVARRYLPEIEVISIKKLEQIVNKVAEEYKGIAENATTNEDLISRSGLLECFKKNGVEITFDLPVEELLGEDVDIDDFTMLVQDAVQAYKKMVIDTIKNQPIVSNEEVCEWEEVRLPGEIFWRNCRYREDREYSPYFEYCPYCGKKIKVV